MNILILTRIAKNDGNSIYNSYTTGICNNYSNSIVIDYFNLYFEKGKEGFETTILDKIEESSIDLVFINFVSGDLTFDLTFLKTLSEKCYMLMNFYDTELFFEPIDRYYAQCANLVLLPTPSYFTHSYSLLGISAYSSLSLFDSKKFKQLSLQKDIDISFVGDITKKSRQVFLEALIARGYNVEVYGKGSKNGSLSFEKMIEIFNRSKINLNFSDTVDERDFNSATNTDYSMVPNIMRYMTQLKGRSIEIAMCEGFTLSQYAVGIEELFAQDEIALFYDIEDLITQVDYFLQHDEIRQDMAQKAYKKATSTYDTTLAFRKIFDIINITERITTPISTDKVFLENYSNYHFLYLFNFLFKFRINLFLEEVRIVWQNSIRFKTAYNHCKQQFSYQIKKRFS